MRQYLKYKHKYNIIKPEKIGGGLAMGLKVENVSKCFDNKLVVDNISFEINEPGVFGLLGTNGAGKTTTIRMILGIIKKDKGEITWNGKAVDRKNVNFGYLPEERGIYPKSKIFDQLLYFAELKGMKVQEASEEIKDWMERLKIDEYQNMTAEKLSKGNQQKVQFITAILNNPELIVLDEPFSGLDPVNTELLKEVIIELVKKGKYIIMSSHQMTSIEEFCKDVVIINKGKTVLKGNLKEIKNSYQANRLEINANKDITSYINEAGMTIEKNIDNNYEIKIENEEQAHSLMKTLVVQGVKLNKFELQKPSLNDIFIEKVGE